MTGTTRGIGRVITIEFSSTHRILAGDRDATWAGELVAELDDVAPFVCSLADEDAIAAACAGIGRLGVPIHSAGIGRLNDIGLTSRMLWREVFEMNVFAVASLTRPLLPALEATRGIAVAINSGARLFSSPGGGAYAGSKFVLRTLTDALYEGMHGKVRVCSIHPGWTNTDVQHKLQMAVGNEYYDGSYHVSPGLAVAAVRLAINTPNNITVKQLNTRPNVF